MRLRLKVLSYQRLAPGQQVEKILERRGGSIGRSPTCDWRLPDPTRVVSGHHADVEYEPDGFYIVDRSTNGLFLNHTEEALGTGNRIKLNDGDVISLGEYEVQVTVETMDAYHSAAPIPEVDNSVSLHMEGGNALPPLDPISSAMPASDADDAIARLTGMMPAEQSPQIPADDLGFASDFFEPPKMNEKQPAATNEAEQSSAWDANWLDKVAAQEPSEDSAAMPEPAATSNDNVAMIPDDWENEILGIEPQTTAPAEESDAFAALTEDGPIADLLAGTTGNQPPSEAVPEPAPERMTEVRMPEPAPAAPVADNKFAATSAATPAPTSQPSINADPQVNADALSAFFTGFGYKPPKMSQEEQIKFMQTAGSALRESIEGILEALKSRAVIKGEIQASQTMIGATENNPLKFSVNFEDAVFNMFEKRVHGFLSSNEAIREAMHDIKTHQVGLMAGTDAVLHAMLDHLSPERIKPDAKKHSLLDKVGTKDSKSWKEFVARHEALSKQLDENPQSLYAKEFAAAYEAQMEELKREAIRHLYQEPIF